MQPRFYLTEDDPRRVKVNKRSNTPRLRPSITPGTVLILLAGRHMGKVLYYLLYTIILYLVIPESCIPQAIGHWAVASDRTISD